MSASRTALRLAALLFLLAGILLLRKPVFGQVGAALQAKPASQTITSAPTRFSVVIQGVAPGKGPDAILISRTRLASNSRPAINRISNRSPRRTL